MFNFNVHAVQPLHIFCLPFLIPNFVQTIASCLSKTYIYHWRYPNYAGCANKNSVNLIKRCICRCTRSGAQLYVKVWGELIIFCIIWLEHWVLDQLIKLSTVLSKTFTRTASSRCKIYHWEYSAWHRQCCTLQVVHELVPECEMMFMLRPSILCTGLPVL